MTTHKRVLAGPELEHFILRLLAKIAAWIGFLALVGWIVFQIRDILPPFLAAFLLAIALAPIVDRLEARRLPRWLAATLVYLLVFGMLAGLVFILVPIVTNQIGQVVADLRGRFRLDQPADVSRVMAEQISVLGRRMSIPPFLLQSIVHQAKSSAKFLTHALETFGSVLLGLLPNLIWFVLVPVVGFYALIDYNRIFAKMLLLVPRSHRNNVRGVAGDVSTVFSRYLRGLLLVCLMDTVATICVLLIFPPTRPYAAALGLIAGVLYAVPYLGAIVSTGLIALIAFASPDGGSATWMLWVTLTMVLLHQVCFDQVITPRVLGSQVGLHPILSIFALLSGNALFGISGMLIAVPAAASLQVIIVHLLPRLARTVEVQPQGDQPDVPRPQQEEAKKEVRVASGEGVVSQPTTPPEGKEPPGATEAAENAVE